MQVVVKQSRRAFTLLELILVLLVMAIMVAMAIPAMRGLAAGRGADECAGQMLALAHYARSQAIAEGVNYRLNIDPTNKVYYLTKFYSDPLDASAAPGFYELGVEMGSVFRAPADVTLEWDNAYASLQLQNAAATGQILPEKIGSDVPFVEFTPSGRTDACLIRVIDRDGTVTQVVCPSATETIRVIRPDGRIRS
ncbi:pilus assembly FimT family protein [Humisphaera borealis]|uniref:Prepilin-type N-terminal cleavage/methylation domain-containing protein n=1 Tax=Humisphaera borealis TaxID=2807512 RepID=A0A7M2WWA2_9BACT|nr:prepilin-type N-terminal cleavage/methylation domain-containing protein [Humisphaera borealis]QOV89818.1 prepilin-type N-terminal cleavage/methylation domain-containing protein [Humisphaera borealis]